MQTVVLLLADPIERQELGARLATSYAVKYSQTIKDLSRIARAPVNAIVWEPGVGLASVDQLAEVCENSGARLIARTALDGASVRDVVAVAKRAPSLGVSIRANGSGDVARLLTAPDPGPSGFVLSRLPDGISTILARQLLAVLVVSSRTHALGSLAGALGSAPRTVQLLHQRNHLACPRRLLDWGQAVWTAWRLARWGLNAKQAACAAGFTQAASMTASFARVVGLTPMRVLNGDGLPWLVDRFIERVTFMGTVE